MSYGERLTKALKYRGMNQSELAKAVGIKPQSVQYLCSGGGKGSSHTTTFASILGVSAKWLETGKTSMLHEMAIDGHHAVFEPTTTYGLDIVAVSQIPVISSVQAGNLCEAVDLHSPGHADEWVTTNKKHSKSAYALRVDGISMEPKFYKDDIIIVDPEIEPRHGKFVVAKRLSENGVTFKQFIVDGNDIYLKALNPSWPEPIIKMNEDWHICGVAINRIEDL